MKVFDAATFWKRLLNDWRLGDPVTFFSKNPKGNHKIKYYGFIVGTRDGQYGRRLEVGVVYRTYWNGEKSSARNIYLILPEWLSVWKNPIPIPKEVKNVIRLNGGTL